ncbi:unnamed protein product, partial [marine sediment metagenome]
KTFKIVDKVEYNSDLYISVDPWKCKWSRFIFA